VYSDLGGSLIGPSGWLSHSMETVVVTPVFCPVGLLWIYWVSGWLFGIFWDYLFIYFGFLGNYWAINILRLSPVATRAGVAFSIFFHLF